MGITSVVKKHTVSGFMCARCHIRSLVRAPGLDDGAGRWYFVCEHCGAVLVWVCVFSRWEVVADLLFDG